MEVTECHSNVSVFIELGILKLQSLLFMSDPWNTIQMG